MLDSCILKCNDNNTIKHLTKNYFINHNDTFVSVYGQLNTYLIFNEMIGIDRCFLKVVLNYVDSNLLIIGSLRKWFYGATSLSDFTKNDLYMACELLSTYLSIKITDLFLFEFTRLEIGINIPVRLDESIFLSKVVRYKNDSRYTKEPHRNSVYFETIHESLILYNKIKEIIKHSKKKWKTKYDSEYLNDIKQNNNVLRIEQKFKGGNSQIIKKLGIQTLGDYYLNYIRLLSKFWINVNTLEFYSSETEVLIFNPEKKSIKEFTEHLIFHSLNSLGFDEVERMINKLEPNARRQARRIMKSKFKSLANKKQVNIKNELMKNVRREITMLLFRNKMLKQAKRVFTINNSIR